MRKGSLAIVMFLAGVGAGTVAALMFAPEKGKVTRRNLRRGVGDLVEKGRGWIDESQQELRGRAGEVADRIRGR